MSRYESKSAPEFGLGGDTVCMPDLRHAIEATRVASVIAAVTEIARLRNELAG